MAPEYQELNDEQGESPTDEKESSEAFSADSVHDLPSTGSHSQTNRAWFHFRLRTVLLLLLGIPLGGWFVRLMIQSGDNDPFDEPLIWTVLALLIVWCLVYAHCTRFSRCPECGKYALGEEGDYRINFLKVMFSLSGHPNYWEICRNCGYREWHEVSES